MAKISVLVETDIFIDYFKASRFRALFDSTRFTVYYSIVTKNDLLTKSGLRDVERESILAELNRCRHIPLSDSIADPRLRQAFGRRARPSDLPRTARVCLGFSRLRAPVRDAAQRFRDEPSRIMRARRSTWLVPQ